MRGGNIISDHQIRPFGSHCLKYLNYVVLENGTFSRADNKYNP